LSTITKESIIIEKCKTRIMIDEQLQNINIPKGLIESLVNAGFTIETILNSDPSHIAEVLGIDNYVAQIIYQETKYYDTINDNQEILRIM